MDQSAAFTELWHILEDMEDLLKDGYKQPHPAAPQFKVTLVRDNPKGELHPVKNEAIGETSGEVEQCKQCDLHLARNQAIVGQGNLRAKLMIVLPAPDYDADDANLPISGEAREFLTKWIEAIGLNLEKDCYITNVVKCRPPGNRPPFPEELAKCRHFLRDQVDTLRPSALLLLGPSALSFIKQSPEEFEQLRGRPLEGPAPLVLATYDPFWVQLHPQLKRPVWEDLKLLKDFVDHGK